MSLPIFGCKNWCFIRVRAPHSRWRPKCRARMLLSEIQTREPVRPSKLVPKLARDIDYILAKALRKEPEERYRTVDEFGADLQAVVERRC